MKLHKFTLLFLVVFFLFNCENKPEKIIETNETIAKKRVSISYRLKNGKKHCSKELVATINDTLTTLISFSEQLNINIQLQEDFNNDGALDILLENRKGCYDDRDYAYLKHEGSSFFIISYDGEKFRRTKEIGKDWGNIGMELKNERLHFTIETAKKRNFSHAKPLSCNDKEDVFIFDGYDFKKQSSIQYSKIEALKEISHSDTVAVGSKEFYFNLNNSGIDDTLLITYKKNGFFELQVKFEYSTFQEIDILRDTNRIGVLKSKTNGVHDLVLNCNTILKWNGTTYVYENDFEKKDVYKVFAKNGLIIRDRPEGNPIGKFDYGEEIEVIENTNIKFRVEEGWDNTIYGYWFKTIFFDKTTGLKKEGYVFSGYLINLEYCNTLFTRWGNDYPYFNIHKSCIVYFLHGQCAYSYPIKIINENEVELIWAPDADCVFDAGLSENFSLEKTKVPEVGKPFAKYTYDKGDKLKIEYYYPEWVKKYGKHNPQMFKNYYTLPYESLTEY